MKKIILISLVTILLISCDKEVFTGIVDTPITEFGKVYISSNPQGYQVYVDDKNWGIVSPDTVLWLTIGNHKLSLKHEYFSDSSMYVDINRSVVQNITINMEKNPRFYAKVICSSYPHGAKIFLNSQSTGKITPTTLTNVYPGEYNIKFTKNVYRDDSLTIIIKGGKDTEIYRILEDTSSTVSYRQSNSKIPSNELWKVVVDKNNNKWIGSIDHGLIKFDGKNWTSYENEGITLGANIQDLLVDKTGKLWVGTSKSLTVFDGISWQSYTDKLPSESVTALEEDINGNIWIATMGGLVRYINNSFQVFTSKNTGFPFDNISSLSSSKTGELWVGSNSSGIFRFNGTKWIRYIAAEMKLDTKNVSDIITDILVDHTGNVWAYHKADEPVNLMRALVRFDGVEWKEINLPILFYLTGYSFYLDNDNNIWMSAAGGLIKYSYTKPLKVFDHNTYGFISKHCTSFVIDQNGDGWLTTLGAGIAKLKKSIL